jgi:hypothetical protein
MPIRIHFQVHGNPDRIAGPDRVGGQQQLHLRMRGVREIPGQTEKKDRPQFPKGSHTVIDA